MRSRALLGVLLVATLLIDSVGAPQSGRCRFPASGHSFRQRGRPSVFRLNLIRQQLRGLGNKRTLRDKVPGAGLGRRSPAE